MTFVLETIRLGLSNLRLHLLRSVLTALGIIFGIAAVILMIAITKGSERDALKRYEILGARNVILRSSRPPEEQNMASGQGQQMSWITRYGLTRKDLRVLQESFADKTEYIVPLKAVGANVTYGSNRLQSQAFGTTPDLPKCASFRVSSGRYLSEADLEQKAAVCVIGHRIAEQLFRLKDPIGETLRIDDSPFVIIGVLDPIGLAGAAGSALVGRDLNSDIHIPLTTAELSFGDLVIRRSAGKFENNQVELSEVYLAIPTIEQVDLASQLIKRSVEVNHPEMKDATVIVPHELIEQAKRTAQTYTRMMVAIAAISLLVGGIGIMNIMLASVTERTREIGIRRALGATRRHIISQFLVETGVLSTLGGLVGIGLGIGAAVLAGTYLKEQFPTQVTGWSIIVSFMVACAVGVIFGLYPALVAARQDPIVALRHD